MDSSIKILSFVGGHDIEVYDDCCYDETVRKYRGGKHIGSIPYSGKMLSAYIVQDDAEPLSYNDIELPTKSKLLYAGVDEIPSKEVCDYCIVSNLYLSACKELGVDTSRLLTIGGTVVDDDNRVIGVNYFCRN